MKIDWKHLCTTPGYLSLKQCMITDITKKYRSKKESVSKFNWVIGRAKHYAYQLNKPIDQVLSEWESSRDYWYLNYYQDSRFPKLNKSTTVKPMLAATYRKRHGYNRHRPGKPSRAFTELLEKQKQQSKRKGAKARWTVKHKLTIKKRKARNHA